MLPRDFIPFFGPNNYFIYCLAFTFIRHQVYPKEMENSQGGRKLKLYKVQVFPTQPSEPMQKSLRQKKASWPTVQADLAARAQVLDLIQNGNNQ